MPTKPLGAVGDEGERTGDLGGPLDGAVGLDPGVVDHDRSVGVLEGAHEVGVEDDGLAVDGGDPVARLRGRAARRRGLGELPTDGDGDLEGLRRRGRR